MYRFVVDDTKKLGPPGHPWDMQHIISIFILIQKDVNCLLCAYKDIMHYIGTNEPISVVKYRLYMFLITGRICVM